MGQSREGVGVGLEKVCKLGLELGTLLVSALPKRLSPPMSFKIVRLKTLFCVLVFNLIHSLLMVLYNYQLHAVNFVEHTPNVVQSQRNLVCFHF